MTLFQYLICNFRLVTEGFVNMLMFICILCVKMLPISFLCREPRGFAFVQFVDPYEAAEAQYHMNRAIFAGREITVVVAAETRKRPEEMRRRSSVR